MINVLYLILGFALGFLVRSNIKIDQPIKTLNLTIHGDVVGEEEFVNYLSKRITDLVRNGRVNLH